jgi:hypothetical protein
LRFAEYSYTIARRTGLPQGRLFFCGSLVLEAILRRYEVRPGPRVGVPPPLVKEHRVVAAKCGML